MREYSYNHGDAHLRKELSEADAGRFELSAMEGESLILSDGRTLGFRCLGDPGGQALFFFHGTPGSRLVLSEADPIAQIPGIRLVVPERPGYGISDPKPDRVLLDWARDVTELADHLGMRRFAVAGESGGGPHALACAHALENRVTVAFLLGSPSPAGFRGATSGMSAGNRIGILIERYAPWLVRRMIRGHASAFWKDPEGFVDAISRQVATSDRALLENRSFRDAFLRDLREAYKQGGDGQAVDGALATARDWGFSPREITVPVYLWHGEEDRLVSLQMARRLATEIPTCSARFVPGAGHLLTDRPDVVEELRKVLYEEAGE